MTSKRIIGLTGSIATGKSTVSNIISSKGYKVIDADKIAHKLMQIGEKNYNAIVEYFGENILNEDLTINRKLLSKIVFNDESELKKLNSLTHDNIFNTIRDNIEKSKEDILFIDIALLIELLDKDIMKINFDQIWLVYTDKEIQLQRLINRNSISRDEAIKKINAQMSIDDKVKYADIILDNTKSFKYLEEQVLERLRSL